MTLPDKLSEASAQQLAKQIDFFQALTTRAFDNAERILALNIQTTRATLDQASGAVRQLAEARDPRDMFSLGNQSQQQMEALLAYGRKLMEITNKPAAAAEPVAPATAPASAAPAPAPEAHVVTAPPVFVSEPAPATASATAPAPAEEHAQPASAVAPSAHPMGEADPEPAPVMAAKPKAIARAASKVAAAPADTPHPAASPMPEPGPVAMPAIAPVDTGAEPASASSKRTRGAKKR